MAMRIKAFFICLLLTQMCFARGGTGNSFQNATATAVARPAPQTDSSPEPCVGKIDQLSIKVYREAWESARKVDVNDLRRQKAEIANKCLPAFSINSVVLEHLAALAKLYFEAQRPSQADHAISRYLKSPGVNDADRAQMLRMAIDYSLNSADKYALAEKYLAQLDQLGAAVIRQRIDAHLGLVSYYLSAREDPKALPHEMAIVNLSKTLPADAQQKALDETISTVDSLAAQACSEPGAARSCAIIEQIPPELIGLAKSEIRFELMLGRYLLLGQEAPQLFPRNVLNAPNGEDPGRVHNGQVTVMLFAAYWCGPCHQIYPQVIEIYHKFQASGVRVLLVTQLTNLGKDPREAKPEEEVATIQEFYLDEVKVPFPILIEGQGYVRPRGEQSFDRQKLIRQASLFSFYPMMLVIDKKGRTRAILLGALPGQGERLRAKVEELLKEPA